MNETRPGGARTAKAERLDTMTVGEYIAAALEACGVSAAFGVISIHNMPILDAIARRGAIRFVAARGEAGALNMADAYARVRGGLGVGVTSTGVAAGNAAGSLVEARTAGSPVLHLTGQIETAYLDQGKSYIHEAHDQPGMLSAISKAFFRIEAPEYVADVMKQAIEIALTPPMGPVSIEIPIDVQSAPIGRPQEFQLPAVSVGDPEADALSRLGEMLSSARRPLLWLGGGARGASAAARRLADLGVGIVTSVNGRGVVPEDHPMCLGAFNNAPPAAALYRTSDLMVVVGSRLRGNETLKYRLQLPEPLVQVDVDPTMNGRAYANDLFVHGDAKAVLKHLAEAAGRRMAVDDAFAADVAAAKSAAVARLMDDAGPYAKIVDDLRDQYPKDAIWVRDVTVSNSTWGNRYVDLTDPRQGVHALGGGIGQGLPMAVGASLAAGDRKVVALAGDGGFALSLGELGTAAQEHLDITVIMMNDNGYGVIRNIQDAQFGGRRHYSDVSAPDFEALAQAFGFRHVRVSDTAAFADALAAALAHRGLSMVEVDMTSIGPFARAFAGPPVTNDDKRT